MKLMIVILAMVMQDQTTGEYTLNTYAIKDGLAACHAIVADMKKVNQDRIDRDDDEYPRLLVADCYYWEASPTPFNSSKK